MPIVGVRLTGLCVSAVPASDQPSTLPRLRDSTSSAPTPNGATPVSHAESDARGLPSSHVLRGPAPLCLPPPPGQMPGARSGYDDSQAEVVTPTPEADHPSGMSALGEHLSEQTLPQTATPATLGDACAPPAASAFEAARRSAASSAGSLARKTTPGTKCHVNAPDHAA